MKDSLVIRPAAEDDIDFIVETIIESDKSSTDVISACNIFSIPESEYRDLLKQILAEDFPNSEYSLSGYLVAESEGEKAGAVCCWVENADGLSNSLIKSSLLMNFIEKEKLMQKGKKLEIINGLSFERTPNTIQIEYGYVVEPKRRQKIFTRLVLAGLKKHLNAEAGITSSETIMFEKNIQSFNCFRNLKYNLKEKKTVEDSEVNSIFPYNTKVQQSLDISRHEEYFKEYEYLF